MVGRPGRYGHNRFCGIAPAGGYKGSGTAYKQVRDIVTAAKTVYHRGGWIITHPAGTHQVAGIRYYKGRFTTGRLQYVIGLVHRVGNQFVVVFTILNVTKGLGIPY